MDTAIRKKIALVHVPLGLFGGWSGPADFGLVPDKLYSTLNGPPRGSR
jgi:hypothetical protein